MTKTKWAWVFIVAAVLLLLVGALVAKGLYFYPKAQVASAANNPAPDFTLPDALGKPFTLSSLRGHRVVLYFYRGYW